MGRKVLSILLLLSLLVSVGCATVVALDMPGPSRDGEIHLGAYRSEVEDLLGVGPISDFRQGERTHARYEYEDGPHQATKLRVLIYLAGDVFTLFLSEVIFWPIELVIKSNIARVGNADYDEYSQLLAWKVKDRKGKLLFSTGTSNVHEAPAPEEPKRQRSRMQKRRDQREKRKRDTKRFADCVVKQNSSVGCDALAM